MRLCIQSIKHHHCGFASSSTRFDPSPYGGMEASYTKIEDGVPVAACPKSSATRQLTARVCPAPIGPEAPYFVSAATRPHLEWHFLFAIKFQTRPPGQDA